LLVTPSGRSAKPLFSPAVTKVKWHWARVELSPLNVPVTTESSLSVEAVAFGSGIREHRDIENGLHSVKDVVLAEDDAPFHEPNAATNWSIIRTIVLNLVRQWGYRSLSKAQRFLKHDIDKLFHLLTIN